jgi:hypothetical protein
MRSTGCDALHAREFVYVSGRQLRLESGSLSGGLGPDGGGPCSIVRRPRAIGDGLGTQPLQLLKQLCFTFARRQFEACRVCVASPTSLVANFRHPISVGCRLIPIARGALAAHPVAEALERRVVPVPPRAGGGDELEVPSAAPAAPPSGAQAGQSVEALRA